MADRGFTGHEHLPSVFGLIDMNGRMYDPVLGRFLSPDPYVQSPDYAQNFNRYAYCFNNPLVYTDPSGEFILELAAAVGISILGNYIIGGLNNWINNDVPFTEAFHPANGYYGSSLGYSPSTGGFGVPTYQGYIDYEAQVDAAYARGMQSVSFTMMDGTVVTGQSYSGSFLPFEPNVFERMQESSILGRIAYEITDGAYITAQNFTIGAENARHLSGAGVVGSEALDAGINTLSMAFTSGAGRMTSSLRTVSAAKTSIKATGQAHHLLGNKITRALNSHPTLKGAFDYSRTNSKYIYNALDDAAHKGYQTWHRQYDATVVKWLQSNPSATPAQFNKYLHNLHQQPWLKSRIPNVNLLD